MVATSLAVWIGSRSTTKQMPVASLMRRVVIAAAVRVIKGSSVCL
jgi:hypothetical protein